MNCHMMSYENLTLFHLQKSIIHFSFYRAATVFVGLAVIVGILSVIALLLFCFMKSGTVFEVCGVMQLLTGKTLVFLFMNICHLYASKSHIILRKNNQGNSFFICIIES